MIHHKLPLCDKIEYNRLCLEFRMTLLLRVQHHNERRLTKLWQIIYKSLQLR
jgi:hypothetical protein